MNVKRFGLDSVAGKLFPESKGPFMRYKEHAAAVTDLEDCIKQLSAQLAEANRHITKLQTNRLGYGLTSNEARDLANDIMDGSLS